jgi:hypothetical protein
MTFVPFVIESIGSFRAGCYDGFQALGTASSRLYFGWCNYHSHRDQIPMQVDENVGRFANSTGKSSCLKESYSAALGNLILFNL